jgi:hypothetical protein
MYVHHCLFWTLEDGKLAPDSEGVSNKKNPSIAFADNINLFLIKFWFEKVQIQIYRSAFLLWNPMCSANLRASILKQGRGVGHLGFLCTTGLWYAHRHDNLSSQVPVHH